MYALQPPPSKIVTALETENSAAYEGNARLKYTGRYADMAYTPAIRVEVAAKSSKMSTSVKISLHTVNKLDVGMK